jgi:hypothetical protein
VSGRSLDAVADRYRRFAEVEAAPVSPRYAQLAAGIAADAEVLTFLAELPAGKVLADADRVRTTMLTRATQTNEPARCAALLPLLAGFPGPLTLIEVGASAGLCLHPDRYAYDYDGVRIGGPSPVQLTCATSGPVPVPARLPEVVGRIGIDLHPLDPADADDRAWLHALIWPGRHERHARLEAACGLAAAEPARMLTGHLLEQLPAAVALALEQGTAVVFHTAVLAYLSDEERSAFAAQVGELPVRWISQEGPEVLPAVRDRLPDGARDAAELVLAVDGEPVARTAPHGGRLHWLAPP